MNISDLGHLHYPKESGHMAYERDISEDFNLDVAASRGVNEWNFYFRALV